MASTATYVKITFFAFICIIWVWTFVLEEDWYCRTCPTGWTGCYCTIPLCSVPCYNGICEQVDSCKCNAGWTGFNCSTPICTSCPPEQTCVAPNTCKLATFTCAKPCENNGRCNSSLLCDCSLTSFEGPTCSVPRPEDGPYLIEEDASGLDRARKVDIQSHYITNKALEYANVTWHVCTMMKNNAVDLAEWIEAHYLMGTTHISIYDHESTDNLTELVKFYMFDKNIRADPYFPKVELIHWPPKEHTEDMLSRSRQFYDDEEKQDIKKRIDECRAGVGQNQMHAGGKCQGAMIADCATRFRHKRDWISWHDVDEFFWVAPQDRTVDVLPTVSSFVNTLDKSKLSMYIGSITYGTSSYQNRSQYEGKLVMEAHLKRAPYKDYGEDEDGIKASFEGCKRQASQWGLCDKGGGKSLSRGIGANWKITQIPTPHYINGILSIENVRFPLRMNHYQIKSVQEAEDSAKKQVKEWSYHAALYASEFWNYVYDDSFARYTAEIRKRLKERGLRI